MVRLFCVGAATLVLIAFAIVCTVVASDSQKSEEVKHDNGGSHLTAYHEAFQKQPAHIFDFRYFKNVPSVSARGSWKSVTGRDGDQLSDAQNSYLICTKENRNCVEATARAGPRADLQFYTVTRWDDRGLEAEDDSPICVKNILTIEFSTARVVATDVLRQDDEKTVETCANIGIRGTTIYQLW